MRNVTVSSVPETTVTPIGVAVPEGDPGATGCRVTVTFAGGMDPLGKPFPVTLMLVTPGSPTLGVAVPVSVTVVAAFRGKNAAIKTNVQCARGQARTFAAG